MKRALIFSALIPLSVLPCLAQDSSSGIVWYPPIQLSDSTVSGYLPRIALSGDDSIHVTWEWGGMRVAYARSIDGGKSFEPTRELLPDSALSPNPTEHPFILASGEKVFLFFLTSDPPFPFGSLVRMFRSTDGGTTFDSVRDISPYRSGEITWGSSLGDTLALIYPPIGSTDPFRKILRSTDGGLTWSQAASDLDWDARITLTPGKLHRVQWGGLTNAPEVEYKRSADLGDSWELDTLLSANDTIASDLPTIASYQGKCGSELLVAWRDLKYGCLFCFLGASIISRVGLSNGDVWLPEVVLTPVPKGTEPRAALLGGNRAVAWTDEIVPENTYHVAIRATNSSIGSYPPELDLTPLAATDPGGLQIALTSHAIHVVYCQNFGGSLGTFRILYRRGEFIPSKATFALSTSLVSFDTTEINSSRFDSVVVMNTGSDVLTIGTAVTDNENFAVAPSSASVAQGTAMVFHIHYKPTSFGAHMGRVLFYHNGQSSPDCFTASGVGKWNDVAVSYPSGWELVSVPLRPGYFQTLPSLYAYAGSYVLRDTLQFGVGYWAKPDSLVRYFGVAETTGCFAVKPGWNMVGSLAVPVPVSAIRSVEGGVGVSGFYEYEAPNYALVDTLLPGRGYWVKVSEAATLELNSSARSRSARRLKIVSDGEMPPSPPDDSHVPLNERPNAISLEQNYPNPFNPMTVIGYRLPFDSYVTLKVYDMLGRMVATIVDEKQSPGYKSVAWDASSVPSGIYFCTLSVGNHAETRKLLLIR